MVSSTVKAAAAGSTNCYSSSVCNKKAAMSELPIRSISSASTHYCSSESTDSTPLMKTSERLSLVQPNLLPNMFARPGSLEAFPSQSVFDKQIASLLRQVNAEDSASDLSEEASCKYPVTDSTDDCMDVCTTASMVGESLESDDADNNSSGDDHPVLCATPAFGSEAWEAINDLSGEVQQEIIDSTATSGGTFSEVGNQDTCGSSISDVTLSSDLGGSQSNEEHQQQGRANPLGGRAFLFDDIGNNCSPQNQFSPDAWTPMRKTKSTAKCRFPKNKPSKPPNGLSPSMSAASCASDSLKSGSTIMYFFSVDGDDVRSALDSMNPRGWGSAIKELMGRTFLCLQDGA